MRIEWLNKNASSRVIIFFNGWGMDAAAIKHLGTKVNLLMVYDYRTTEQVIFPDLAEFKEIVVVAWSMGVWAASRILSRMSIQKSVNIALNGTECPVDDHYGIPLKIYHLTEQRMNERGREIFMQRMLGDASEVERFKQNRSVRPLEEVCEELSSIRKQCAGERISLKWNRIYVSTGDVIFPVENQLNWWKGRAPIYSLPGGHYPFYQFQSWEEIINDGNN